ncbi:MAG: cell division protein FtsQ/DivIB [bacterium]
MKLSSRPRLERQRIPKRKTRRKVKPRKINWGVVKVILILGLTGATLAGTYYFIATSPQLAVDTPIIEAKENARKDRIQNGFNLYCLNHYRTIHPNIFQLDLKDLADYLSREPGVSDIEIKRQLPNTIKIIVKEREPQAIIPIPEMSRFLGIDNQGVIFDLDSCKDYDLPFITGLKFEGCELGQPLKAPAVREVLTIIDQLRDPEIDLSPQIAEFNIEKPKGIIGYTIGQAIQIRFGSPDQAEGKKLRRLKALLKYLREREERMEYIDLRFKNIVMKKSAEGDTEDRGQNTEDKGQTTEERGQILASDL